MAHRTEAFRNVSEAIHLDSRGEKQVAFLKYLQSIKSLCEYISEQYEAVGHTRLLRNVEENKQILSVIKECSERMNVILCSPETPEADAVLPAPSYEELFGDNTGNNNFVVGGMHFSRDIAEDHVVPMSISIAKDSSLSPRSLLSESMKRGNAQLFKIFHQRIENAKDERTKINLKLELHRRLAENRMLAIKKQAEIVRQQQKENRRALEHDRSISGSLPLSEREQEKRKIFDMVLQYDSKQVAPIQLKFITSDPVTSENARQMFESTLQIKGHPIAVWLVQFQTKIKCEIETALREYSDLADFLPDKISDRGDGLYPLTLLQSSKKEIDVKNMDDENTQASLSSLSNCLDKISLDIRIAIDDILEVFCLAYKSLLPEDAKIPCYRPVEATLLQPLWPSLTLLFRMRNFPCERRIAETIVSHLNSGPEVFGISSSASNSDGIYFYAIHQLRLLLTMPSLVDKISTLVQVSQKLCGENIAEYQDDGSINGKLIGADDLICMLSYVIVQARIPQLVSECNALEQLMDQKYMLGEEGYSLTSFLTALKYLEMKKLIDAEGASTSEPDE